MPNDFVHLLRGMTYETFNDWMDAELDFLVRDTFDRVHASEGSLWLTDPQGELLVVAYNTGPRANELEHQLQHPVTSGVIGMVYATEQAFLEQNACSSSTHSKVIDEQLGQTTLAMMATPFYLGENLRGVLSCVQLAGPSGESADISSRRHSLSNLDLRRLTNLANVLSELIELRLRRASASASDLGTHHGAFH